MSAARGRGAAPWGSHGRGRRAPGVGREGVVPDEPRHRPRCRRARPRNDTCAHVEGAAGPAAEGVRPLDPREVPTHFRAPSAEKAILPTRESPSWPGSNFALSALWLPPPVAQVEAGFMVVGARHSVFHAPLDVTAIRLSMPDAGSRSPEGGPARSADPTQARHPFPVEGFVPASGLDEVQRGGESLRSGSAMRCRERRASPPTDDLNVPILGSVRGGGPRLPGLLVAHRQVDVLRAAADAEPPSVSAGQGHLTGITPMQLMNRPPNSLRGGGAEFTSVR